MLKQGMETTKKSRKKSTTVGATDELLKSAYKKFVLINGHKPASVYKFCLDVGISEEEFYNHFGSFEGLEKAIWQHFIDNTVARLHADASFSAFNSREKVLAFYYALMEVLRADRSFILLQLNGHKKFEIVPEFLKGFKASYEQFMESILAFGKTQGEVATRPYLDKRYPQLFWLHMSFLLIFWKDDNSAGFERTDVAIEKSVNLAFDLIGKGAIDSAIDFGKFLFQMSKMK
jgi:AcrR family transcriptional regulator